MLINELSITFVKTFFMNLCMTYTYAKIKNIKIISKKEQILLIAINIIISSIYALIFEILRNSISIGLLNLFCYAINILITAKIINGNYKSFIILLFISLCFGYVSFFLVSTIMYMYSQIPLYKIIIGTYIEYLIAGIMQFGLIYVFFKIKRFKDGFYFLKDKNSKSNNILGLIVSFMIIAVFIYYSSISDYNLSTVLFFSLTLGGIGMINWIKKNILKNYKQKMKDRTVEIQAEQIKEKDETINNLKEELEVALSINHKYNSRLSSMEKLVSTLGTKLEFNEEFAKEYSDIKEALDELSKEYRTELFNTTQISNLPKTNILSIDNLLEYMKTEANKENIEFNLEINGNISNMVKEKIPKNKLETMIADHIKDAIIAIKCKDDNTNKSILVKLGIKDKYYELSISDTGIEFEIDTLLKLGLQKVTTHKETGGSGIGFITTFETMKQTKASLIIEEHPISNKYTKTITIRLDGNNEYQIISDRAELIKQQMQDDRIKLFTNPNLYDIV